MIRNLRFNVSAILAAILFVAIGCVSLREADEFWDGGLLCVTLGLLLGAVLLAAHRTQARRAFWIGFALFGWGYLGFSLVPAIESRLITTKALAYLHRANLFGRRGYGIRIRLDPDLMRTHNVSSEDIIKALTPSTMLGSPEELGTKTWQSNEYELTHISRYNHNISFFENLILTATPDGEVLRLKEVAKVDTGSSFYIPGGGSGTTEDFVRVGHSLSALLAGWFGGVLSRRLWAGQ